MIRDNDRNALFDVLPLPQPYRLYIETSGACNFHCRFCPTPTSAGRNMDMSLFAKVMADLSEFPTTVPHLLLSGNGEALLNPLLPEMLQQAKSTGARISIITNASLLTPELSKSLIAGGLDLLRVSLEGLSDSDYESLCGVRRQFDIIMSNIKFYYTYSRSTSSKIAVRLWKQTIPKDIDETELLSRFMQICDNFTVDSFQTTKFWPHFQPCAWNYSEKTNPSAESFPVQKWGIIDMAEDIDQAGICTEPFISALVKASGDVLACCADYPEGGEWGHLLIGNLRFQSLSQIWNGETHRRLLMQHLIMPRSGITFCDDCGRISIDKITRDEAKAIAIKYCKMSKEL
jgi:MoaA/NifB/PqqE/SkfB family radical SAM enzyme